MNYNAQEDVEKLKATLMTMVMKEVVAFAEATGIKVKRVVFEPTGVQIEFNL